MNAPTPDSELASAVKGWKRTFIYTGFISFFINLLMLVPPLYMLQIYDRVLASRSEPTLLMLTLIVVVMFVTMGLLEFVRSRIMIRLGNRFDVAFGGRLFDALLEFAGRYPGRKTTQALSDLAQIRQFVSGNGLFGFFDAPWLPIYIFVLYLFHPLFALFAVVAALILIAVTLLNEYGTRKRLEAANAAHHGAVRFVGHNLQNAEVILAMGMAQDIKARWLQRQMRFLTLHSEASDRSGQWSSLSKTLRIMFQSLILGLGAYLAIYSEVSAGMMIAGSIIMGRALAPLDLLINSWKGFSGARQGYRRIDALLREFPLRPEPMALPDPKGEITLENLVVVPPEGAQPSVRRLSMKIAAGEVVGVVGPSAAGKSSLAKAALGVWPLLHGKVRIDGAELDHWPRERLGRFIGYLPQEIELFEGTVGENIARFGDHDAEAIVEAAKMTGIHEMILQFPRGYDTVVGVGGLTLSGGQRQRIGLARALYKKPVFVVLDEPNSNLDEAGEKALTEAVATLKEAGTTVLLITHRLPILQSADKIAVMAAGELKLFGERDEVLRKFGAMQTSQQARQMAPARQGRPVIGTNITMGNPGASL